MYFRVFKSSFRRLSRKKKEMVKYLEIVGYDQFISYTNKIDAEADENDPSTPTFFFFSGSKLPNGESWCPDCSEAEPVIEHYLADLKKDVVFAYVDVGDRDYWKNKSCPFRTDKRTKLMVIPTIIKWQGVQRLEGSQCNNRELLQLMFEEED